MGEPSYSFFGVGIMSFIFGFLMIISCIFLLLLSPMFAINHQMWFTSVKACDGNDGKISTDKKTRYGYNRKGTEQSNVYVNRNCLIF